MNILKIDDFNRIEDLLVKDFGDMKIVFTTAEKERSFNRFLDSGRENLNNLKNEFDLKTLNYIKQIHSDKVIYYKDNSIIDEEGDAIITKEVNEGIGVFTADCIPVIIINEEANIMAAIHSGWKGTISSITKKTLEMMIEKDNIDVKNTKVIIGPHIRSCCYEVSEDLKERFLETTKIEKKKLFNNRNLNLEECILKDVKEIGILDENLYSLDLCTHCSKEVKLFSYRKSVGTYGRLFSLVFKK